MLYIIIIIVRTIEKLRPQITPDNGDRTVAMMIIIGVSGTLGLFINIIIIIIMAIEYHWIQTKGTTTFDLAFITILHNHYNNIIVNFPITLYGNGIKWWIELMIGQPASVPAGYMVVRVLVGISGLSVFSRGTNLLAHQTKRSFKNRIHQSGKRARVSCPSSHLGSQQAAECRTK